MYEIYFVYKGLPYRRLRDSERGVDQAIRELTLKGATVKKIVKW